MNGVIHFKWQIWNDLDQKDIDFLLVSLELFIALIQADINLHKTTATVTWRTLRMQECRSFHQSYILLMLCYSWCNRRSLKLDDCTRKSKFETDRFEKSEMNLTNTLLMFGEMPQTPVNLTPCKWLGALKKTLQYNIMIWKACSCNEKYFRFKYPLASLFKHFSGVISRFLILQNFEDFHNSSLAVWFHYSCKLK